MKGSPLNAQPQDIRIGVIGGSGLYEMDALTDREEVRVTTPFGDPSSAYIVGVLNGRRVAFLARHGPGHRLMPSELNFRANIFGFKTLGVDWILSASAVGSLREEYRPLDIVIPDQLLESHPRADQHLLRRWYRRPCRVRPPVLSGAQCHRLRRGHRCRGARPSRRHLRVHGGSAVLHVGRVEALSLVGEWTSSG